MFGNLMNLPLLCLKNVTRSAGLFGNVMCNKKWDVSKQILSASGLHISAPDMNRGRASSIKRKMEMESVPTFLRQFPQKILSYFPHPDLQNELFQNVPFKEIPIVSIKVSMNNTIYSLSDHLGHVKLILSCGIEGYKNSKKGTNIAAQATGISFARRAVDMGYKTVRLQIKGLGAGRGSCVKGLINGGLEIISVTDRTPVSDNYQRPKKLRRV